MNNKIVTFHEITEMEWFERVILLLKSKYRLIDIKELESFYHSGKPLKNTCHITIDDGHFTFYSVIYPVLKKHGIPASLFVSPLIIKEQSNYWFQEVCKENAVAIKKIIATEHNLDFAILNRFPVSFILKNMQIDQIRRIIDRSYEGKGLRKPCYKNITEEQLLEIDRESLVTIGAHTKNHPMLANEDNERSTREITESFILLKELLGHDIRYFAYPNGLRGLDFGPREIEVLKQINCSLAFDTQPQNFSSKDNPLSIPRFTFSLKPTSFVKAKLFFGRYWNTVKEIKTKSEQSQRITLKKIFDQG